MSTAVADSCARSYDIGRLRETCRLAALESTDPHTQNGAMLYSCKNEIVAAANQVPPLGSIVVPAERPAKYMYIEHAERHVIYKAARLGVMTEGATMYCPWFACSDCARAIILSGISRVVGHVKPKSFTPERWQTTTTVADAMLREAGVEVVLLEDKLDVRFMFNGEFMEL